MSKIVCRSYCRPLIVSMSRTLHFGRDILDCPDVDLEDLLAMLSPSDIESMVNEMAADPDDKHLPASVRTAYR